MSETQQTEAAPAKRGRVIVLLAGVCLVGAAVAAVLWLRSGDSDHPDAWDPRVEEFVEIVEGERDLDFEHPIHVDFLPVDQFKEQVAADEEELTEEDREELEQTTGIFRALGLLEGDIDLFETANELRQAGVVGYYSFDDSRIRIRGTELTPDVQSTLVHELTHALQDQHFGISKRYDELEEADDDAAASAYQALVEGDARRIEAEWREELDEDELAALDESQVEQRKEFQADSKDIPEVLETLMASPYEFGEAMLRVAVEEGGSDAVDELFEDPPTTEEHQLDPWTLVVGHEQPLDVPEPTLEKGDEEFDDGPFGALSWLVVLAERIPAKEALTAADGWAGDAYVGFERDGVTCLKVNYQGESNRDLAEMQDAVEAWAGAMPDAATEVTVSPDDLLLELESCDPGPRATPVGTGGSRKAVTLALSRTYLSVTLVDGGYETEAARCGADRLVRAFTVAELNSPDTEPAQVRRVIRPCLA